MGRKTRMSLILVILLLCILSSTMILASTLTDRRIADVSTQALKAVTSIQAFCDNRPCGMGSGFVVDSSGLIITNYHVIAGATRISVELGDTVYRDARLLGAHKGWDLALLKVHAEDLPALSLARDIQMTRTGQTVIAVGDPGGLRGTVSTGIVSALRPAEELGMPRFHRPIIQTTASISHGSSGGPLLNLRGEVIGVNFMMHMDGQNLNFALPIDFVHTLLQQQSISTYEHQIGDLAVMLEWEGDFDLDLEIWSQERNYIGSASWLGDSPDRIYGDHGGEWFVFQEYRDYDFSSGRFIVSPYFSGPETEDPVFAVLTIILPDGHKRVLEQELWYLPPYDQWLAVEIHVDEELYTVLEPFEEEYLSIYEHEEGELAVMLQWKGDYDLDLEIWTEDFEYINKAFWIGESPDILHGDEGSEWFVFRQYMNNDFSHGRYIVSPYFTGPESEDGVLAVLTIFLPHGGEKILSQDLYYHPPYDQWFAVLIDTDVQEVEILDFFLD